MLSPMVIEWIASASASLFAAMSVAMVIVQIAQLRHGSREIKRLRREIRKHKQAKAEKEKAAGALDTLSPGIRTFVEYVGNVELAADSSSRRADP